MACELHHGGAISGSASAGATLAIVAVGLLYLRGWMRLPAGARGSGSSRTPAAFAVGMLVVWAVMGSPLSGLDHVLLTFHMVQHLLLMTVAAPLILLGKPVRAISRALPQLHRGAAGRFLRSAVIEKIGRLLAHPVFCWLAGTAAVLAWHVPAALELAMSSRACHLIQHATFLGAGLLFWRPVIEPASASGTWAPGFAPVYLFLATFPCDALSAFLAFCGRVVYPSHQAAHRLLGLSPLQDQECAGALMWFWVTVAYLLPAVVLTLRMLSPRLEGSHWFPGDGPSGSRLANSATTDRGSAR